jgi:hypothetical protein
MLELRVGSLRRLEEEGRAEDSRFEKFLEFGLQSFVYVLC